MTGWDLPGMFDALWIGWLLAAAYVKPLNRVLLILVWATLHVAVMRWFP
jgi:hypothetical protein